MGKYSYKEGILDKVFERLDLIPEDIKKNIPVSFLNVSDRTSNALKKNQVVYIEDLYRLRKTNQGIWIEAVEDIDSSLLELIDASYRFTLSERLEQVLTETERSIIYNRSGFLGPVKTLEETAKIFGVTRERVRQIEVKAIRKLDDKLLATRLIKDLDPKKLTKQAERVTELKNVIGISKIYDNEAMARLLVSVASKTFTIQKSKRARGEYITLSGLSLESLVDEIYSCLIYQKAYIPIKQLADHFKIERDLIQNLKNIDLKDEYVAYKKNLTIFYRKNSIIEVEKFLSSFGKPATIVEIQKETGLTEGQIRGSLDRSEKTVNVGSSLYALKEWNYITGKLGDVVYYFLKEADQPLSYKRLVRLVSKQRYYRESSIYAAIYSDKRIQQLDTGHFVLKKWGYKNIREKRQAPKYDIPVKKAVFEILSSASIPLSLNQIQKKVSEVYGDKVSNKQSSISASLYKLVEEKKISKISRGRFVYFLIVKNKVKGKDKNE